MKFLKLIILFVIFFDCALYYVVYQSLYTKVKKSAEKVLLEREDGQLDKLEIDIEKGISLGIISIYDFPKEIKLNNSYYDIKHIQLCSGKYIIFCYHDQDEKKLEEELQSRQNNKSTSGKGELVKKVNQDYILHIPYIQDETYFSLSFPSASIAEYRSFISEKNTPPPNYFI